MRSLLTLFLFCLLPALFAKISPADEGKNHLINPALKISADGKTLEGWKNYNPANPFSVVTDESNTIRVSGKSDGKTGFGLKQEIEYEVPSKKPINIGGWSKASDVKRGAEYCIYLDILHPDGSWTYSIRAQWKPGTHDWEYAEFSHRPKKPVKKISYFILLRKNSGTAMFRDVTLTRKEPELQVHYVSIFSMAPWKNNAYRVRYAFLKDQVNSEFSLFDAAGKVLYTGKATGKTVDQTVECQGVPVKVVVKGNDGKTSKEVSAPIIRLKLPSVLPNGKKEMVWTTDSMTKVSPLTFPDKAVEKNISIALAGGERESAQIQISNLSAKALNGVTLEFSELKDSAGRVFPGKLSWERIAYVPRAANCNPHKDALPDGIYWLPDPLLPAASFSVLPNSTQGLWITATADRKGAAGTYRGVIRINGMSEKQEIPVAVTLYGFDLPKRFSYRTAFAVMDGYLAMQYPNHPLKEIRRKAWDVMLDHRLNPDDITRTSLPEIEDLLYARERGMNYFTICNLVPEPKKKVLWSLIAPVSAYNEELWNEFKRRFDPYVAELKKHGLDKDGAFYGFDERGKEYFQVMAKLRKDLNQRYGIPLFTTSAMFRELAADPKRTDCYGNDWYCPPTMFYKKDLAAQLRAKGHQVWWYTCCGPYYPYANFASLEYPFHDARILAWMSYYNEADGFLFWHTNNWYRGTKYMNEASSFQPDFRLFVIGGAAGDGQFLYPGKDRPFPSIRLANIRDGSEDYDYLKLLEQAVGKKQTLALTGTLVPDVCNFVTDHKTILKVRDNAAKMISRKRK